MKLTEACLLLAMLTAMVLVLTSVGAAPTSDLDRDLEDHDNERLTDWLLKHLGDYRRDRRTQMDAGFLSRHSALKNFLNAYDAGVQASDPYGPGRRK